jgi:hypothetical protein
VRTAPVRRSVTRVTGRQKAYLSVRGAAVGLFILSATVFPPGIPAALCAMAAGVVGILTCIGVNAGGPGEAAGARLQAMNFEHVRPPQGDWPPYDESRIVDGELVTPPDRPAR